MSVRSDGRITFGRHRRMGVSVAGRKVISSNFLSLAEVSKDLGEDEIEGSVGNMMDEK